jgi:hypothetical protein
MRPRRSLLRPVLVLLALLFIVGWIETPEERGPIQPGPNAPVYVDWRTGELVDPRR